MDKSVGWPRGDTLTDNLDRILTIFSILNYFGELMVIDDWKDYGKFSTPEHPSPIHHWWIGELLRAISLFGSLLVLGNELTKDDEYESNEYDQFIEQVKRIGEALGVK